MGDFNPLKFSGRIGRMQFLVYGAGLALLLWVMWFGLVLFVLPSDPWLMFTLLLGLVVVTVLATSSYGARRLQDMNQPGALYWLSLIPGVSLPFMLVLLLVPGTPGPNRFGTRAGAERHGGAEPSSAHIQPAPTEPSRYAPPLVSGRAAEPFIDEPEGELGEEHYSHSRAGVPESPRRGAASVDVGLGVLVDPVSGREVDGGRVHLIRVAQDASGRWLTVCGLPVTGGGAGSGAVTTVAAVTADSVRIVAEAGQPTCVSCLARM